VLATQVYTFLQARNDVGASAAVAMFMAAVLAVVLLFYLRFFGDRDRQPRRPRHPEVLLSAVTITIGLALFAFREPVNRFLNSIHTPPEGELFDRGYQATLKLGWWVGVNTRSNSPAVFLGSADANIIGTTMLGIVARFWYLRARRAEAANVRPAAVSSSRRSFLRVSVMAR
jgi:ABC-type Fe3+ transport system permease subunit